jgi:peptide/nickel transport system substrate-binding protein
MEGSRRQGEGQSPTQPVIKGEAVVVQPEVGETFLPYLGSETDRRYKFVGYDPLFTQDTGAWNKRADWEIKPAVLESWKFSTDWSEFSARVRRGIQFQRGQGELTADDVAFLINETVQNPKSGRGGAWRAINISAVATSRYDVVIRGDKGQVSPAWVMSEPGIRLNAVPSKAYIQRVGQDAADLEPIGSGPFELTRKDPGIHLYRTIPNHWREQPNFEMLRVWQVPEPATRLALLETGGVDVAVLDESQVAEARTRGIRLVSVDFEENAAIYFGGLYLDPQDSRYSPQISQQPWGDKRVRTAMSIAIDREGIAKSLLNGAVRLTALPYPSSQATDLKPPSYNPQEAKRMLADAGFSSGFPVTILATDLLPSFKVVAEAIATQWKAVGLDAKIQFQEVATLFPQLRSIKSGPEFYGKVIMWSISSRPNWWPFMPAVIRAQVSGGYTLFSSATTTSVYQTWRANPNDISQTRQLERRAVVELNSQVAAIPLYSTSEWFGIGRRVVEFRPSLGGLYRYETLRLR